MKTRHLAMATLCYVIHLSGFLTHPPLVNAQTGDLIELTVDAAQTQVAFEVDAGFPLGSSADRSAVSGKIWLELFPSAYAPELARIVDLQMQLDDDLSFRLAGGLLRGSAPGQTLTARMIDAGPAGEVLSDAFSQFDSGIELLGEISLSVNPGMVDLAELDPVDVDFEEVGITRTGRSIGLGNALELLQQVPIDTGIFGTRLVDVTISGKLDSRGEIPIGTATWLAEQGLPGDGSLWSNSQNWLRDGNAGGNPVPDLGPQPADQIVLPDHQLMAPVLVEHAGTSVVGTMQVDGDYRLSGGQFEISPEQTVITIVDQKQFFLESDLTASEPLRVTGEGTVWLDGQMAADVEASTTIGGRGRLNRLTVEPTGTLIAPLSEALEADHRPFEIESDAFLQGAVQIVLDRESQPTDQVDAESLGLERGDWRISDLLSAGSIIHQFSEAWFGNVALESREDGFFGHAGDGLFVELYAESQRLRIENYWAIPGDLDGDGSVGFSDFVGFSRSFGMPGGWLEGDFDRTGEVGFSDFVVLSNQFGQVRPTASSVPEPTFGAILALASVVAMCRSRRSTIIPTK